MHLNVIILCSLWKLVMQVGHTECYIHRDNVKSSSNRFKLHEFHVIKLNKLVDVRLSVIYIKYTNRPSTWTWKLIKIVCLLVTNKFFANLEMVKERELLQSKLIYFIFLTSFVRHKSAEIVNLSEVVIWLCHLLLATTTKISNKLWSQLSYIAKIMFKLMKY